ncbi:uncharacterized protein LOC128234841 [Mya arenaria]|uniref:uncharacterized protein LOC128234841 n=1 Tax=Mya arenaria TaxID=6604 RepID=UPI0022E7FFD3|nr:uncharacterized protein LOC128234841 [Mya arenaria]XP_052805341.1 uncharacterized protein LOC128234841 [Mya arenaria]
MDTKFSDQPDLESIQPERLIKYRVSDDGFAAEVLLPGFTYTDFDQKIGGKLNLWSLAKVFEAIRFTVLPKGFGHFPRLKDDGHSMFMASALYKVTDKGNEVTSHSYWGLHTPFLANLKIFYAGTSAFSFNILLSDYRSGETLVKAEMSFVYVDFKTRKPCPFPDWYNQLKEGQELTKPSERLVTPDIPHEAFKFDLQSAFSDIDHNGHVNQSVYVKWCTDAGTEAALKGHYSGFKGNIGTYPMNTFELKYVGEVLANEPVVISTWQDKDNHLVLHFVISKESKVAVVAKFIFLSLEYQPKVKL